MTIQPDSGGMFLAVQLFLGSFFPEQLLVEDVTPLHFGKGNRDQAVITLCGKSSFMHVSFVAPVKTTQIRPSYKLLENCSLHTSGIGL